MAKRTRDGDDFLSGYCCALSAAMNGEDGTATSYIEAVRACGAKTLLEFAKRTDDMELPKIRAAVAEIKRREKPVPSGRDPGGEG